MLQGLYLLILRKTAVLYTVILQTPVFFFDLWSIVHFFSGSVLFLLLASRRVRRPVFVLFLLLAVYEFVEIAFTFLAIRVFLPEILPDQVTDVWVGLLGGLAVRSLGRRWHAAGGRVAAPRSAAVLRDLTIAVFVSAVWVASYGYSYNVPLLNSSGINWWALLWWSGGLFALLRLFGRLRGALSPQWLAVPATWAVYVAALLTVEYVGYSVLGIRELHGERPLVFDVIHGTPALKLYYAVAGLLTIGIASGVRRLARREAPAGPVDARPTT